MENKHSSLGESHLDRYLYPLWLRTWHWLNAGLFLLLIASGVSMHFSSLEKPLIPFEAARLLHNISGILLTINYAWFVVANFVSGNYRQYVPVFKNIFARLFLQARFYLYGIFRGEDHPFHISLKQKFNPLQQIAYMIVIYYFIPFVIGSGILLFFPELAPENFLGFSGITPVAIFHISIGYMLTFFMVVHVYLATHGETITEHFHGMITGYHSGHIETHPQNKDESSKEGKP